MVWRGLIPLLVVSCGRSAKDSDPAGPEALVCDEAITWESFARPFLETWCTGCHSALVVGEDRNGAPEGLDFDSYAAAVRHGAVIGVVAGGDEANMPPSGGPTAQERERLLAWLECGTPGETTSTTGCAPVEGDWVMTTQADADALCSTGPVALLGSLGVTGDVRLDCVCAVDGAVDVSGSLSASELRSTGTLTGRPHALELPELVEVAGAMTVESSSLTALVLPELREVRGELTIRANPALVDLSLPRLSVVEGDIRVDSNPVLVDLQDTLALEQVDGVVRVVDNDGLVTLGAFRFATGVGGVEIRGNDSLIETIGFEVIATLTGDITVADNQALRRLSGFDSLETLHGNLVVRDHPLLESRSGFGNLTTVDGDLTLGNNPSWSPQAFVDALTVGGSVNVY